MEKEYMMDPEKAMEQQLLQEFERSILLVAVQYLGKTIGHEDIERLRSEMDSKLLQGQVERSAIQHLLTQWADTYEEEKLQGNVKIIVQNLFQRKSFTDK